MEIGGIRMSHGAPGSRDNEEGEGSQGYHGGLRCGYGVFVGCPGVDEGFLGHSSIRGSAAEVVEGWELVDVMAGGVCCHAIEIKGLSPPEPAAHGEARIDFFNFVLFCDYS